jgi:hypothetical protein
MNSKFYIQLTEKIEVNIVNRRTNQQLMNACRAKLWNCGLQQG